MMPQVRRSVFALLLVAACAAGCRSDHSTSAATESTAPQAEATSADKACCGDAAAKEAEGCCGATCVDEPAAGGGCCESKGEGAGGH